MDDRLERICELLKEMGESPFLSEEEILEILRPAVTKDNKFDFSHRWLTKELNDLLKAKAAQPPLQREVGQTVYECGCPPTCENEAAVTGQDAIIRVLGQEMLTREPERPVGALHILWKKMARTVRDSWARLAVCLI